MEQLLGEQPEFRPPSAPAHGFRLVERRLTFGRYGNTEPSGRLERLGSDGKWEPYPNNGFRALLDREELPTRLTELVGETPEEDAMETTTRFSDRLAQIAKRQMAAIVRPPEERTMEEVEPKNGVGATRNGKRLRKKYTEEFKAETVEKFIAAASKNDFAKEVGIHVAMLQRWKHEAKPGATVPKPAKPGPKLRAVRVTPPADPEFDHELDVLRQLLALPADARGRIVAYLTARGR